MYTVNLFLIFPRSDQLLEQDGKQICELVFYKPCFLCLLTED